MQISRNQNVHTAIQTNQPTFVPVLLPPEWFLFSIFSLSTSLSFFAAITDESSHLTVNRVDSNNYHTIIFVLGFYSSP